jgi:hypothetical protein
MRIEFVPTVCIFLLIFVFLKKVDLDHQN